MNTTKALSTRFAERPGLLTSPQAQQFMGLSRARGWDCQVLGQAPLPTSHIRVGKWLLVPAEEDTSQIPARTLARVQAIYQAGLRPKGFVLVHEAPLELAAPAGQRSSDRRLLELPPEVKDTLVTLGRTVADVAPGVFMALAQAVGAAIAVGAAVVVGGPLAILFGLALLDPILIAVTEDGYWIEIDRWNV